MNETFDIEQVQPLATCQGAGELGWNSSEPHDERHLGPSRMSHGRPLRCRSTDRLERREGQPAERTKGVSARIALGRTMLHMLTPRKATLRTTTPARSAIATERGASTTRAQNAMTRARSAAMTRARSAATTRAQSAAMTRAQGAAITTVAKLGAAWCPCGFGDLRVCAARCFHRAAWIALHSSRLRSSVSSGGMSSCRVCNLQWS